MIAPLLFVVLVTLCCVLILRVITRRRVYRDNPEMEWMHDADDPAAFMDEITHDMEYGDK